MTKLPESAIPAALRSESSLRSSVRRRCQSQSASSKSGGPEKASSVRVRASPKTSDRDPTREREHGRRCAYLQRKWRAEASGHDERAGEQKAEVAGKERHAGVQIGLRCRGQRGDEGRRKHDAEKAGSPPIRNGGRFRTIQGAGRKKRGQRGGHAEPEGHPACIEVLRRPTGVDDRCCHEGERGQRHPLSLCGDEEDTRIEKADVAKERVAMIFAGR